MDEGATGLVRGAWRAFRTGDGDVIGAIGGHDTDSGQNQSGGQKF